MLIPYVKISLDESLNMVGGNNNTEILRCIPEIYFGPTPHPNLSRTSLEMMLMKEWVFRDTDSDGMPIQKCLVSFWCKTQ